MPALLASNKKYTFICLLPEHLEGEYWTAVETGIHEAIATYSDFNTSVKINYYDPYDYHSFENASEAIPGFTAGRSDGSSYRSAIYERFHRSVAGIGYTFIYIDSNIKDVPPLAFFGQNSRQSGIFCCQNDDVTGTG